MITIHYSRIIRILIITTLALLAVNISPGQAEKLSLQPLPLPAILTDDMGTSFTYQGRLTTASGPVTGTFDFKFELFDSDTGGAPLYFYSIAPDGTDTPVTNGLFMVAVDFGPNAFSGYERWLEISVRPGASSDPDPYTTLAGRQKINPTPYATFARTIYRKTVVVKPVTPDGSFTDNGKVLLNALNDITDASADNRYLLKIEPGIYDLFEDHLVLKPYVDVEGSGEGATLIKAYGMTIGPMGELWGAVTGADGVEMRDLTIESNGYETAAAWFEYAIGVYVPPGTSLKMTHVTVNAHDGKDGSIGIYNDGLYVDDVEPYYMPAILALEDVTVIASFNDDLRETIYHSAYGIYNDDTSSLTMADSSITAMGGLFTVGMKNDRGNAFIQDSEIRVKGFQFTTCFGIYNYSEANNLEMRNSRVIIGAEQGLENSKVYGIENPGSSGQVRLFDSVVDVLGSQTTAYGIDAVGGGHSVSLYNVVVMTSGNNTLNIGVRSYIPMIVRDSEIQATGGAKTIGMELGETEIEVTQTVIRAEGADPLNNPEPYMNKNIGAIIWGGPYGSILFERDSIQVSPQASTTEIEGGVGLINVNGGLTLENSTINSQFLPAYNGIYHIFTDPELGGFTTVNNSEIYTCRDAFYQDEPDVTPFAFPCPTVQVYTESARPIPYVRIGSSLLYGGPVVSPAAARQCVYVHDEVWAAWPGPVCP